MSNIIKPPSPQAASIYSLLQEDKAMSAKEIGKRLKIFPNAVYRTVKELLALGFVEEVHSYPVKFQAKPASQALEMYSLIMRQSFFQKFGLKANSKENLKISFFETRKQMLSRTQKETLTARYKINIIISGHEIPAETFLAFKRAADRGVKIRVLIQGLDEERKRVAKAWQKVGAEVKNIPNMSARILVYDGQITYFGSYNVNKQPEAVGVCFDYAPYAALMDELFEQRWNLGKEIRGF